MKLPKTPLGLLLTVALLGAGGSPLQAAAPTAPTETRLIDFYEPLGVDNPAPRFGWHVNDADRGERQTAYEILVAANPTDLANNQGTLWDSGKVASAQDFGVVYAGSALAKVNRYWWKVRTWDKDDQASPWSAAQNFMTGFFQAGDWNPGAQWIRRNEAVSPSTDVPVMFRKTFPVSKTVKQAFLYATGLGQFVASLNGAKVGNHVIDPAWTDYDQAVNYVTFDVTSQIVQGTNALGVMLGSGWLNATDSAGVRPFGVERMLAQLHIDYTDGTSDEIVSDPTWKVFTSPFTSTDIHGMETYDARLDQAGWNTAAFNDSAWPNAVAATAPSGVLSAQCSPPVVTQQTFTGTNISSPSANNYVFDFGQNMEAQFEVKVSGSAGAKVTLTPGEFLNSDGTVNPGRSGAMTYTLKGGGTETWRQTFSAVGMRYVQVGGVSTNASQTALPYIQGVTGYWTYTASNNVGSLATSDPTYNKIRDLALNALRSNLTGIHSDGPNQEKLGWQEVVWTTLSSTVYQHDLFNLYTKLMKDTHEGQRSFGLCSTIAPNYFYTRTTPSKGMYDDAPAWGAAIFNAPWQLYQTYGDTKILSDNYAAMTSYLAYLKSKESNGLVNYNGLGDWMAPGGTQVANVEGAVYVHDTQVMRDVATVLGKSSDATFYGSEFTRVLTAYNNAYFDSANGRYNPVAQNTLALPLEWGIVPSGRAQDVANALVKDIAQPAETTQQNGQNGSVVAGHLTTGDIGTTFLWRALGDYGQQDLVQTMLMNPASPGYLSMINAGETAMAENWNIANIRSHDHDMYCGILEYLYRTPGGISSLQPGYSKIQLKPGMPSGLGSVTATYDSVHGPVGSAWAVSGNQLTWNVQVPVNTTASICVPTFGTPASSLTIKEGTTAIYANGASSGSVAGLTYNSTQGTGARTFVVWDAGSGSYQFSWQIIATPTGVTATAGVNQIVLNWAVSTGATSYHVKRSGTSGGPYTALADNVTGTTFTDTAVSNGSTYDYVVSAQTAAGESANSAEVSAAPITSGNFGFETPSIGTYQYNPAGAIWTFSAQSGSNGSGLSANGSAFTGSNAAAPEGKQVAFLQGTGTLSQTLYNLLPGASYLVMFSAAQRVSSNTNGQTWQATLDGAVVGTYAPAQSATAYVDYTASFTASKSSHTLGFVGTDTRGGDNTVFLDNVRLSIVASKLSGTIIGTPGSWNNAGNTVAKAFDADLTSYFDSPASTGWAGLDFGTAPAVITQVRSCPRPSYASRMVGGVFQGANAADFSDAATLFNVANTPASGALTAQAVSNNTPFRYVRYLGPANSNGNVAELEFDGFASPPLTPTGLSAAAGLQQVSLAWNAAPGAVAYQIKRSSGGAAFVTLSTTPGTPGFVDTGLGDGTVYAYRVFATNATGSSADSNTAAATPAAPPITAQEQAPPVFALSPGANGSASCTVPLSVVGHTYQLQSVDDLAAGSWLPVPGVAAQAGNGANLQFTTPVDTSVKHRFYRIAISLQ